MSKEVIEVKNGLNCFQYDIAVRLFFFSLFELTTTIMPPDYIKR